MNKNTRGEGSSGWLDADHVKEQLPIIRVLEHYELLGQLDVQGGAAVGLSPFHDSQVRSFRVELERNLWNDFSGRPRGCAGHSIGLIQALEDCSFREALEIAADLAGITRETRDAASQVLGVEGKPREASGEPNKPPRARKHASRARRGGHRRSGIEVDSKHAQLDQSAPPRPASPGSPPKDPDSSEEYEGSPPFGKELRGLQHDAPFLRELGISEKTAKAYGVGMAVRGLMKSLLACPVYIPGTDTVAAYVGRRPRPKTDQHPWKNPSGFRRSEHLFGLERALVTRAGQRAVERHGLLVVQSPLSVLRLAESGLLNAVALMDTEVSSVQADLLTDPAFNPAGKLTLMLNADERGEQGKREAARRLIYRAHIRYAAWHLLDGRQVSPKDLDDEAIRVLIGLGAKPTTKSAGG